MQGKDVVDAVQNMRPTVYRYNGKLDDGVEHFGFIAQELEQMFPMDKFGLVTEDKHGNKMVRYNEIIPLVVKYIHQLEKRVSKLEENVEVKDEV